MGRGSLGEFIGKNQTGAGQLIVIAPILEILAYSAADLKTEIGTNRDESPIEQRMDIGPEQDSIADFVFAAFPIGPDMGRFEHGKRLLSGNGTSF